jgi:hypothetical protein
VGLFLGPLATLLHVCISVYIKIGFIRKKNHALRSLDLLHYFFSEAMSIFQHIWLDQHMLGDGEAAVCTNKIWIHSTVSVFHFRFLKFPTPQMFFLIDIFRVARTFAVVTS